MLSDNNIGRSSDHRQPNKFHPVILFHNYKQDQKSIRYGDPYYQPMIQIKKEQMDQMLKANSQKWQQILQSTTAATSYDNTNNPSELMHDVVDNHPTSSSLLLSTSSAGAINGTTSPRLSTSSISSSSTSPSLSSPPSQHHHQYRPQLLSQHSQDCYYETHSVSSNKKRRRGNLPKPVTLILKQWLIDHCRHPYPTEEEKMTLGQRTGLTINQISNWFINARRRILPLIIAGGQSSSPSHDVDHAEDLVDDIGMSVPRSSGKPHHQKKRRNQQQQQYNCTNWQRQQRDTIRTGRLA